MSPKALSPDLSVSPQIRLSDFKHLAAAGYRTIISNRPDGEEAGQPDADAIRRRAEAAGLRFHHIPVQSGQIGAVAIARFRDAVDGGGPTLAFCRSGMRSASLWALSQAGRQPTDEILAAASGAGYELSQMRPRLEQTPISAARGGQRAAQTAFHDVVIVGGGSAGISTAASLRRRNPTVNIAIVEPRAEHYYQPGWTMVGGGVFMQRSTCRPEASVIPHGVQWIKAAVTAFCPEHNEVVLEGGTRLGYRALVVAPGITLDWTAIDGLSETLGHNGVTSNYNYETAPYTWQLVQDLREGVALFTQPPMPIKCAGAPQKAMYLSCDHWLRHGRLGHIQVAFHNAGAALFGVKEYVPPLMQYIKKYDIDLQLESKLVAVDGPGRRATFVGKNGEVTSSFDMLHVCPPQKAPPFLNDSPLANAAGYVDVDSTTMQHVRFPNVFGLGDASSTGNAKTAAAIRQQAPVVAANLLRTLAGRMPNTGYNGYGSCPLTVERGKIVLAEFGYGGKLLPTFPKWLIDGEKPQRLSWLLKSEALPFIYWHGMLKGREWLAAPKSIEQAKVAA